MALWRSSILASDTQLNQKSYYEASAVREPQGAALQGAIDADVLVVGAGFAGLSAAIELAQRGYRVVVLEAERVCSGASGRNGGQAIVGYACGQGPLEAQLGRADARRLWNMSLDAIRLIDERIADFSIACDRVHGYLYVADSPRKAAAMERDLQQQQREYGLHCAFATGAGVAAHIASEHYCAAGYETVSGHLHPLKYGLALARAAQSLGVQIYEGSAVARLQRGADLVAHTAAGSVRSKFAVLAGNCTLAEHGAAVAPEIRARIMPVGTYIAATAPLTALQHRRLIPSNAAVCDNNFVLDYFRFSADHRMLFGGRVSYTTNTPADLQASLRRRMLRVFPSLDHVEIDFVWGGFVDISMNRAPDFGRVEANIYYLQGFSGHGVALTGLAGRMVAQALAGQAEQFDLFARLRHRNFPGGAALRTPTLALAMWFEQLRDAL